MSASKLLSEPSTQSSVILPEGMRLCSAATSIETVASKSGAFNLLLTTSNVEVIEATLHAGKRLVLIPSESSTAINEAYYILEGHFRGDAAMRPLELYAGQMIVTNNLQETVILIAQSNVRFLYISSQPMFHEISEAISELKNLAVEVELKDGYTADHCSRIQSLSYATGQELGLDAGRLHRLSYGAYLHDIGKIKVPLEILTKPAKLTTEEYTVIQQHPTYGRELLDGTSLEHAGIVVEQHHERFDGSGYPFALTKDDILTESFIVAVTDTYDAMTTDRPYRKALTPKIAFEELHRFAGVHYPKEVVKAFCSAVKQLELAY